MSITAIIPVYNEEYRIEATLRCASWCDEIIVVDKQSNDRTRDIVARYTDKIFVIDNREYDPREFDIFLGNATCEWIILLTASDVIHPQLARQIRELTDRPDFPYDIIRVPFRRYVLGMESTRSPWYSDLHPAVFRRRIARVKYDDVHSALALDSKREYRMENSQEACLYHLTHETVDIMMERHMRYCRAESKNFSKDISLRSIFKSVLDATYRTFFKRKTFLMGWNGIALSLAYISYFMLRFIYIWESRNSRAAENYGAIRETILKAWSQNNGKS
ncbi:MAG: glycosyltransferase [Deltaproteobacteria bacterium]